jgi:CelD/BcsL family acetyltransferase involved in cellulose biosynthesis
VDAIAPVTMGVDVAEGSAGPAPGSSRTAIVRRHQDLDALAGAWDELWSRTPAATPFQSHAWTSAWAHAYVPDGRLTVATVWNGDRLVAAAPLYRVRRGIVGVLAPLGGDLTDHTDVLVDPRVPDAGARLVAALLAVPGWRVLDLPEALPGATAQTWADTWPGVVRRCPASLNLQLPVAAVADVLGGLPARTASTLRRKIRKIDQLGVERAELAPADVPAAVPGLIRLHEAQWAGRRGNPEHLTDRFREFLQAALPRMVERGQAVFVEYRVAGELTAVEVDLVGHRQVAYYLAGIAPTLRERIDTAVLLVTSALERAARSGREEYSFLRGDEDYKFRWRPDEVVATRLLLARPGLLGSGGFLPVTAMSSALLGLARRVLRGRVRELARSVTHAVRVLRARG